MNVDWALNLIAGGQYPKGDENGLWDLAKDWRTASAALKALLPDLADARGDAYEAYPLGDGFLGMDTIFAQLQSGDRSIAHLVELMNSTASSAEEAADNIEYTKLMMKSTAGLLLLQLSALVFTGPAAPEAEAVAIAVARMTVLEIAEQLLLSMVVGAAFGAAQEFGIQWWQIHVTHHRHGYNLDEVAVSAAGGAGAGLAAGPVAMVLEKRIAQGLLRNRLITHGASGVAGVGGMWLTYGVLSTAEGQPNWEFDPRMISGAVAGGGVSALKGSHHGPLARLLGNRQDTSGERTFEAPVLGGEPAETLPPDPKDGESPTSGAGESRSAGPRLAGAGEHAQPRPDHLTGPDRAPGPLSAPHSPDPTVDAWQPPDGTANHPEARPITALASPSDHGSAIAGSLPPREVAAPEIATSAAGPAGSGYPESGAVGRRPAAASDPPQATTARIGSDGPAGTTDRPTLAGRSEEPRSAGPVAQQDRAGDGSLRSGAAAARQPPIVATHRFGPTVGERDPAGSSRRPAGSAEPDSADPAHQVRPDSPAGMAAKVEIGKQLDAADIRHFGFDHKDVSVAFADNLGRAAATLRSTVDGPFPRIRIEDLPDDVFAETRTYEVDPPGTGHDTEIVVNRRRAVDQVDFGDLRPATGDPFLDLLVFQYAQTLPNARDNAVLDQALPALHAHFEWLLNQPEELIPPDTTYRDWAGQMSSYRAVEDNPREAFGEAYLYHFAHGLHWTRPESILWALQHDGRTPTDMERIKADILRNKAERGAGAERPSVPDGDPTGRLGPLVDLVQFGDDGRVHLADPDTVRADVIAIREQFSLLRSDHERAGLAAWHDDVVDQLDTMAQDAPLAMYVNQYQTMGPPFVDEMGNIRRPGIWGKVDRDGGLFIVMHASPETPKGAVMVGHMMDAIGEHVRGIHGVWSDSNPLLRDNLDSFNAAIRRGLSREDAALATFTGKMATRHGFTDVRVDRMDGPAGQHTDVEVRFSKLDASRPESDTAQARRVGADDDPVDGATVEPEGLDVLPQTMEGRLAQFRNLYAASIAHGRARMSVDGLADKMGIDPDQLRPSRCDHTLAELDSAAATSADGDGAEAARQLAAAIRAEHRIADEVAWLRAVDQERWRNVMDFLHYDAEFRELAGAMGHSPEGLSRELLEQLRSREFATSTRRGWDALIEFDARRAGAASEIRRLDQVLADGFADRGSSDDPIDPDRIDSYCVPSAVMSAAGITGLPDIWLYERDVTLAGSRLYEAEAALGGLREDFGADYGRLAERLYELGNGTTILVSEVYAEGIGHAYTVTNNRGRLVVSEWNGVRVYAFPPEREGVTKSLTGIVLKHGTGPVRPITEAARIAYLERGHEMVEGEPDVTY